MYVEIYTNLKRQSSGLTKAMPFLDYSCKVLRPPVHHRLCGIYARFREVASIKSFSIMCVPEKTLNCTRKCERSGIKNKELGKVPLLCQQR